MFVHFIWSSASSLDFTQLASRSLYFGRDPLGRRSLLLHRPCSMQPYILISSVSAGVDPAYQFEEVASNGIWRLDLQLLAKTAKVRYLFACGPLKIVQNMDASVFGQSVSILPYVSA